MSCVCIEGVAHFLIRAEPELHIALMPAQPGFGTSAASAGCPAALPIQKRDQQMTKSALLSAAAMLAAVIATPALAQPAMQEPGAYLQHRPWATDSDYRYGRSGFWPG